MLDPREVGYSPRHAKGGLIIILNLADRQVHMSWVWHPCQTYVILGLTHYQVQAHWV
jgi:hypothetical protein